MSHSVLVYLLGGLLLLCSCTDAFDGESLEKEIPVPIQFTIEESYLTTRAPISTIDATNVSSVGIYGVQESTPGQYTWTATPLLSNVVPSGINQNQLSFSPKLYYPMGAKNVTFYAYYPRTTNTNTSSNSYITLPANGIAPTYNFTLSDQQDVMFAVSTPMNSKSGTPVALQYTHQLCQIIVDAGLLTGTLSSITLLSVPTKGSMNLATGAITWNTTTSNISLTIPLLATKSSPILVPANVTSYQVQIALLALLPKTYTLVPSNGVFTPGVIYTLVVK